MPTPRSGQRPGEIRLSADDRLLPQARAGAGATGRAGKSLFLTLAGALGRGWGKATRPGPKQGERMERPLAARAPEPRETGGRADPPSRRSGRQGQPPKGPGRRQKPPGRLFSGRSILSFLLTLGIWGAMGLGAVIAYYAYDLPDLDTLTATSRRPSIVLQSVDGKTIASYGDVYGEPLELSEITPALPQAVMATEDRHFYSHFGLDPIGLARAIVVNLRAGRVVQGGSTISQQLAKNLFLTPERSAKRKIQELLMALMLERKFTKDQIITLYLNRVYLGSGTYGVDAAAKRYFDSSARSLNLYQAALLAGLLKAPSRYNPQNDRELSYKRTAQVLANMVAFGAITEDQAQAALKAGPGTVKQISHTGRYFADWVRDQVDQYAGTDRDIVVQTTLDMELQAKVDAALAAMLAGPGAKAGATQGAVVILSPDGAIRAMAGGADYARSQFNRAVQGFRQPGSSFKAFVYLAAVEAGWNPDDPIQDSPIVSGKYRPSNYTDKYEGPISLRHALAKSSNVAAVRLIETVGPKRVVQVAKRLGITSELRADASLALGTSEVSPLEIAAAYATFANDGNGVWPYGFWRIATPGGERLFRREGSGTGRIVEAKPLAAMTDMLQAVITQGSGKAAGLDRPAAGKTGTTQDYRDAWFVGFTADYACAVWLGNDNGQPMNKVTGATLPAKLWHEVMMAAEHGLPVRPLPGSQHETPVAQGGGTLKDVIPDVPKAVESIWDGLVKMLGG